MTETLETPVEVPEELPDTPFVGLVPFGERDAPFFFGRERERRLIANNLIASRLTLLYGASGVGKSSVLRAGVANDIRRIAEREFTQGRVPEWILVVVSSWRDPPLPTLAAAIEQAVNTTLGERAPETPPLAERLDELLAEWIRRIDAVESADGGERRTRLLIVLDQFEEYFLYQWQDEDKGRLGNELPRAVNREGLRANFAISIREDAYSQLDRFKGRIPNLFESYLRIRHLDHDAARNAIRRPVLETWNNLLPEGSPTYAIDDDLVTEVLRQVRTGSFVLGQTGGGSVGEATEWRVEAPYLQLVMRRLWLETVAAGEHRLSLARLHELGGAEAIVRSHLEDAMHRLEPRERDLAARIFHQLVTPEGTKIAHTVGALANYADVEPEDLAATLKTLADGRILRPADPPAGQSTPRYEIYHDVLAPAVLDWRARHEQAEEQQRLATELARQEAEAARQRAAKRRLAAVAGVAVVLAFFAAGLAAWAIVSQRQAADAKRQAEASTDVARAGSLVATDPGESLALALRGVHQDGRTRELASGFLSQAALASHLIAVFGGDGSRVVASAFQDAGRLVTVRSNGAVEVWSTATARRLATPGRADNAKGVTFAPKASRVAVEERDGSWSVWDTATHRRVRIAVPSGTPFALSPDGKSAAIAFPELELFSVLLTRPRLDWSQQDPSLSEPAALVFSPNSKRITEFDASGSWTTWDVATRKRIATGRPGPETSGSFIYTAAYSPDGRSLAVALNKEETTTGAAAASQQRSFAGTVVVFDADTGGFRGISRFPNATISALAFGSHDRIVAGTSNGLSQIWTVGSSSRKTATTGDQSGPVTAVAVSIDGRLVASATSDGRIGLFDADRGSLRATLLGHHGGIHSVAFAPDGTRITTTSDDGTARLWRVASADDTILPWHLDEVGRVSFSENGKLVLTTSVDGTVIVSHASSGKQLRRFPKKPPPDRAFLKKFLLTRGGRSLMLQGLIERAAFSPDGRHVVTGGDVHPGDATLWSTQTGKLIASIAPSKFQPTEEIVYGLGPKRAWVAVVTPSGGIGLFDGATGHRIKVLQTNGYMRIPPFAAAATEDGRYLVTGQVEPTARVNVWDVVRGKMLRALDIRGPVRVKSVATDARGTYAAASITGGVAFVWRIHDRKLVAKVETGGVPIRSIALSRAGKLLGTVTDGTAAQIWDVPSGHLHATLRGHTQAINSIEFSRDGRLVVTASDDRSVRVWRTKHGETVAVFRQGRAGRALVASFDRAGRRIVAGASDGSSDIFACPTCGGIDDLLKFAEKQAPLTP